MKTRKHKIWRNPPRWSVLANNIHGRNVKGVDPLAGSWSMFYFRKHARGIFDVTGRPVRFKIKHPKSIDFRGRQLQIVQKHAKSNTKKQKDTAKYWGFGPTTKQWTPVIDRLVDTYELTPLQSGRMLGVVQAGINDTLVITWWLKYVWDVARPDQLDRRLKTVVPTPKFPAYPSGHAAVSGCVQEILTYFFPAESKRLKQLAEECADSRLYACVHFPDDNTQGLRLGRQIGRRIVHIIKKELDAKGKRIDSPFVNSRHAPLPPPPYKQLIPFPPAFSRQSNQANRSKKK